jgi:hypothetical protein
MIFSVYSMQVDGADGRGKKEPLYDVFYDIHDLFCSGMIGSAFEGRERRKEGNNEIEWYFCKVQ